jgi:hypothetical protein
MEVKVEADKALLEIKRKVNKFRPSILKEIGQTITDIHVASADEVIPNKVGRGMSPYAMAKLQPSTPGLLTDRRGFLVKMLRTKGTWSTKIKTASMATHSLKGIVKVDSGYKTKEETYKGALRAWITDANPFVGVKSVGGKMGTDPVTGKKRRFFTATTKQQLHMRFLWEHGIRGTKRYYMSIAAKKKEGSFIRAIQDRTNALGGAI